MKRVLFAFFIIVSVVFSGMLVSSCTFGFLDDSGDITEPAESLHCVEEAFVGGIICRWYNTADVLQYYDILYFSIDRDHPAQVERYSAADAWEYGYLYEYDGLGNVSKIAYFDASKALRWFQVLGWGGDDTLDFQTEYDASSAVQWVRGYTYVTVATEEKISVAASWDSSLALTGTSFYQYLDKSALTVPSYIPVDVFALAAMETFYGSVRNDTEGCSSFSTAAPKASLRFLSKAVRPRAMAALVMPANPAPLSVTVPADASGVGSLALSGYRFWEYDSSGISQAEFNASWYPVTLSRTDSRIAKPVTVNLEYDAQNRISKKTTYYGSTLALAVSVAYDAGGFPTEIGTSGAALLLPLEYGLAYDANRRPERLDVRSNGNLLQWFDYTYRTDLPAVTLTLDGLRSVDPFSFLNAALQSTLSIRHYDGDDALVETFNFGAVGSGLRMTVENPDGTANGWYDLSLVSGNAVSLAASDAAGTQLWSYSYGYEDFLDSDIKAFVDAKLADVGLDTDDLGRIFETYLPANSSDTAGLLRIAQNFVFDLLF